MKNILLIILIAFLATIPCFSQTEQDTLLSPVNIINLDSLEAQIDTVAIIQEVTNSDSIYIKRLSALPFQFRMTYNPIVKRYIELYTGKIKDKVQIFIGLSDFYFPLFAEVLNAYQLPSELKYIPIIESALNPRATSRARAVGLWQFMKGTGKENGLTINNLVDQRRSLTESTTAAAKYLRRLYNNYGDWQLVLAAYNCGPGKVNRAIRRSGGKRDFWEIYRYLPRETRGYVPAYIGAAYAFNYYKDHNIVPVPASLPMQTDTVIINKYLHFGQVSSVLGVPVDELRRINPQYIKDMVPASGNRHYSLRVSLEQKAKFVELKDSIYSYRSSFYKNEFLKKEKSLQPTPKAVFMPNEGKVIHEVQSGESIWVIAGLYKVSVTDIKAWNNISGNKIMPGQKIVVYVPKKGI